MRVVHVFGCLFFRICVISGDRLVCESLSYFSCLSLCDDHGAGPQAQHGPNAPDHISLTNLLLRCDQRPGSALLPSAAAFWGVARRRCTICLSACSFESRPDTECIMHVGWMCLLLVVFGLLRILRDENNNGCNWISLFESQNWLEKDRNSLPPFQLSIVYVL